MRGTNIKQLIGLKKVGVKIMFYDCPVCKRFFGTNEASAETCCEDCDYKYTIKDQQVAIEQKSRVERLMKSYVMKKSFSSN
jgi:hypothetical protein